MNEEERAALHREQLAAQAQARRDRYVALTGNRQTRINLDIAWQPVLLAHLEAQMPPGDDCVDSLEEMYVEVPQQDIYISEVPDDQIL